MQLLEIVQKVARFFRYNGHRRRKPFHRVRFRERALVRVPAPEKDLCMNADPLFE